MAKDKTFSTFFTYLAFSAFAAPAAYVQDIDVDVVDSRQQFPMRVARGEIVDMSINFSNGGEPLDISGSPFVSLECKTNGMAKIESFAVAGVATNGNSALFRVLVDDFCPEASGTWTCVVSNEWATLARAGGPVYVRQTAAATAHALPKSALAGYATTNYVDDAIEAIPPFVETDPVFGAVSNGYLRVGGGPYVLVPPAPWEEDFDPDSEYDPDILVEDELGVYGLRYLRQWVQSGDRATSNALMRAIREWRPNPITAGGQFGLALESLDSGAQLTVGGQDALRVVDGYGLAGDTNAEWRISGISRPAVVEGGVTNRPWIQVTVRCSMPGPWREASLWASRDFREWEETDFAPTIDGGEWTYLIPTNTGYRCFRAVGTLAAHPESRLETDFSISAMGDVTASNGLHRLSAKADAADLAGYSPTGHVHAAADITSGTFDAARIPGLAASKITSGSFATARIPNLAATKITSGTLADARIPANIVRDTKLSGAVFDFSDLRGLYVAVSNLAAALGGTVTNFPAFRQ